MIATSTSTKRRKRPNLEPFRSTTSAGTRRQRSSDSRWLMNEEGAGRHARCCIKRRALQHNVVSLVVVSVKESFVHFPDRSRCSKCRVCSTDRSRTSAVASTVTTGVRDRSGKWTDRGTPPIGGAGGQTPEPEALGFTCATISISWWPRRKFPNLGVTRGSRYRCRVCSGKWTDRGTRLSDPGRKAAQPGQTPEPGVLGFTCTISISFDRDTGIDDHFLIRKFVTRALETHVSLTEPQCRSPPPHYRPRVRTLWCARGTRCNRQ